MHAQLQGTCEPVELMLLLLLLLQATQHCTGRSGAAGAVAAVDAADGRNLASVVVDLSASLSQDAGVQ